MKSFPHLHPLALAVALLLPSLVHAEVTGEAAPDAAAPATSDNKPKTLTTVKVTGVPLGENADEIISPVAVLSGDELDARKSNTLGETVSSIPGVTTTYFGPGVGRPVIRGLDGPRVAVLSDGLGTDDVSNVSQDHAVTIEPFLANQIEVLKGPSTLLYGSGAIGGVVNAVDGRIHEAAMDTPFSGRAELRYDAGSSGFTGMGRVDAGTENFALHADAVYRSNNDYDIPHGELANSAVDTRTGALAGSVFGDWGFAGFSVSRYLNEYGNPAEPGDEAEGEPPVTLKMSQTRYDFKAGLTQPVSGIENVKLSFGHTDYQHTEFEGDEVGTIFLSSGDQLRLEATHSRFGAWRGAFGVQAGDKEFQAIGEEAFVPTTKSRNLGVFLVEQGEWDRFKLELGARSDRQSSDPENGDKRSFSLLSLSAGGRWEFDEHWHLSLNLDRAQRAPAEEELFANGPHVATETFEIGDQFLSKETSNQFEIGLHYHSERFEAEVSAYQNKFDNFIFLADTGLIDSETELPIRVWTQTDAKFRGIEGEAIFHLAESAAGKFDLRLYGDRVRATRSDGSSLPRIPAARVGAELNWKRDAWRGGLGVVHTAMQDNVDVFETETDGYTLVNANLNYTFRDTERGSWEAFLQGNNLTNQEARLATSVVKDFVPLPGRNISVGLRVNF
jgi:iron complex outermembrane receptor protein